MELPCYSLNIKKLYLTAFVFPQTVSWVLHNLQTLLCAAYLRTFQLWKLSKLTSANCPRWAAGCAGKMSSSLTIFMYFSREHHSYSLLHRNQKVADMFKGRCYRLIINKKPNAIKTTVLLYMMSLIFNYQMYQLSKYLLICTLDEASLKFAYQCEMFLQIWF